MSDRWPVGRKWALFTPSGPSNSGGNTGDYILQIYICNTGKTQYIHTVGKVSERPSAWFLNNKSRTTSVLLNWLDIFFPVLAQMLFLYPEIDGDMCGG